MLICEYKQKFRHKLGVYDWIYTQFDQKQAKPNG